MQDILPRIFSERLRLLFPDPMNYLQIESSFSVKKPLVVRINTLQTSKNNIIGEFKKKNIDSKPIPWYKDGLLVLNKTSGELTELDVYKKGEIYIQSLSSMIPPLILNPKSGDRVLDIAAAPGSKTSQIAIMIKNEGELVANDVSQERLYKLQASMKSQGVKNVIYTRLRGESLWKTYPEYFDKVLVDAPCSMEGRFDLNDRKSYEQWSLKKVKNLSKLQKWLLRSAVSATKPGGTIVYSTCTLSPEENEGVIDWLLEKEKGKVILVEPSRSTIPFVSAVLSWRGKNYSKELQKTRRIMPDNQMEGFYIAQIKKLTSTIPSLSHPTTSSRSILPSQRAFLR